MLATEQLEAFDRDGIVVLQGAFDADAATTMQAVLWRELERRYGVQRHDPSTWDRHAPTGLVSTKKSRAFDPIGGPILASALDDVLGRGRWAWPKTWGNLLVTMPSPEPWRVPHRIWHSDFETSLATDPLGAVKIWALCDDTPPGGGGTPQLLGSHRLFARFLTTTSERRYKEAKLAFLRSHPWLQALTTDDGDPIRNERFLDVEVDLDGLPARVIELTGKPGDVVITHPWVFHSIATNAGDRPRFMRSAAIRATGPGAPGRGVAPPD